MDKQSVLNIISIFRKSLEKRDILVDRIILFGSFSTGNFTDESDIDIAVISGTFKNMDYWQRIDILSDSIYEVFAPIEAVAFTPEEWESKSSIMVEYAEKGEVVYS